MRSDIDRLVLFRAPDAYEPPGSVDRQVQQRLLRSRRHPRPDLLQPDGRQRLHGLAAAYHLPHRSGAEDRSGREAPEPLRGPPLRMTHTLSVTRTRTPSGIPEAAGRITGRGGTAHATAGALLRWL